MKVRIKQTEKGKKEGKETQAEQTKVSAKQAKKAEEKGIQEKEKTVSREKKLLRTKTGEIFGFSIRTQLIIGFCIPILFLMTVGVVSYQKAAAGLTENYENSTMNALEMTRNSLDSSFKIISQEVMELGQDATVRSYALGAFSKDSTKKGQSKNDLKNKLSVMETSSDLIQNIHIIPVDGEAVLTTKTLSSAEIDSFMTKLKDSEDGALLENDFVKWTGSHPCIDGVMEISEKDYLVFCSQAIRSGDNKALIVIDVSTEEIGNLLSQLDFGENSQVSFVTDSGKEIDSGAAIPVTETEFFEKGKAEGNEWFTQYVTYERKEYFYMMCKSATLDGYITVLVPKANIVKSSVGIRNLTLLLVISATAVAILLGIFITAGISRNIRKSEKSLKRVSEGELFLPAKNERIPKNEFGRLHGAIRNTITKMRQLVLEVIKMMGIVSDSGSLVDESGKQVSRYVQDMNEQMKRVETIVESESIEIENCNEQMEKLSDEIKAVSKGIMETIEQVHQSRDMIYGGQEAVESMTKQAAQTTQATGEVQQKVSMLGEKLGDIAGFAENIQDIASQTNLLSLNASIEAARAGENGRGFSVVAEEIRKLADNAGKTAASIQDMIKEIRSYSKEAVERVEIAEDIVTKQGESVRNTSEAFENMNRFLESMIDKMERLAVEVEGMNNERRTTLSSIRSIGELSGDLVHFSEQMKESLQLQVKAAGTLTEQADKMKENMGTLKETVEIFKVEM